MASSEKTIWAVIFGILSIVGGVAGNAASAAWRTDDRISAIATKAGESAGADAARRVVRDEIGPVVGSAVAASVGPIAEKVVAHIAEDNERQRRTDDDVRELKRAAARANR